jgi:hypothetical protein
MRAASMCIVYVLVGHGNMSKLGSLRHNAQVALSTAPQQLFVLN